MDTFKGKRILVTGACQGIGRGITEELWKRGGSIVALSNNLHNLELLKKEYPDIEIANVDLQDWNQTRKAINSLGVFDGLVNCAGVAIIESFFKCKPSSFDETISINTRAILNVSQIAALKDHVAYCASKGAVDAMTRVMALELGPHGIRVNTVNPTVILTEMGRKVWSAEPTKAQVMLSKIPLGRFGEVSEVVGAVLFLLSDNATMINGVQLPVDGGFLAT